MVRVRHEWRQLTYTADTGTKPEGEYMSQPNTGAVVRAYWDALTSKDFDAAIALLDGALQVDGPINEYHSARDFGPALADFGSRLSSHELVAGMSEGNEAMMLYDLEVDQVGPLRVVEHYTVMDGKITRIRQILDTAAVRAAGPELAHPGR